MLRSVPLHTPAHGHVPGFTSHNHKTIFGTCRSYAWAPYCPFLVSLPCFRFSPLSRSSVRYSYYTIGSLASPLQMDASPQSHRHHQLQYFPIKSKHDLKGIIKIPRVPGIFVLSHFFYLILRLSYYTKRPLYYTAKTRSTIACK